MSREMVRDLITIVACTVVIVGVWLVSQEMT